ncbi:hypothetical protein JDN41_11465, partial [Rhodomicrobium udaipurense]|nr:hypothetical protein [Rhodomicrobium udaipurense]
MAKPESEKAPPKKKGEPKPKLTDAERHKRFVDMAREVEADESTEAFDKAFEKAVTPHPHTEG